MDLVKEKQESGRDEVQIVVQQVIEMREQLNVVAKMARSQLVKAQQGQKIQYDLRVSPRQFEPGQKVLLLLQAENAKLSAHWQGPCKVIR